MAGTGVRSIRFYKETACREITANDSSQIACSIIKDNMLNNGVTFTIENKDANLLLEESTGFDYIDIDPFGTPVQFLDSSVKRIARKGILAVTATDTSSLCGTHPKACLRKYWSIPSHNHTMHEIGLRILIRRIQLIGAQYDKALTPVFSYSKNHYFRIFLACKKGKSYVDSMLANHKSFDGCGPFWAGNRWDKGVAEKALNDASHDSFLGKDDSLLSFLKIISSESKIAQIGFHDLHNICERYKLNPIPKKDYVIEKIKEIGFEASETHFDGKSIRSSIGEKELATLIKSHFKQQQNI